MKNTVLITGINGFLGRQTAKTFSIAGYMVNGIGLGPWGNEDPGAFGIHKWVEKEVTLATLIEMDCRPEILVHCAGSGSVGFSLVDPYADFKMTVDTLAASLEFIRNTAPRARLIYPSSAAIYGCKPFGSIDEVSVPEPVSPYGVHKFVAEQLCMSASRNFGIDCKIVRFFSLYGPGLRKQLLWDAAQRLTEEADETVEFFGTGRETRDWLHVRDAANLMLMLAQQETEFRIVNGGSGQSCSVKEVLSALGVALGSEANICFNGQERTGDPEHLQADMSLAGGIGWEAKVSLSDGLKEYAEWFRSIKE